MAPSVTTSTGNKTKNEAAGMDKTPLEAISHGTVLPGIPTFASFAEHRRHILTHMAAVFRSWVRHGYSEGQSGHISVRDPEYPGCMWMNPLSRHFGTLTAGDLLLLEVSTGRFVGGGGGSRGKPKTTNAAGYFIHRAIHRARPDVDAICHAHTLAGRAWSVFARPLDMLTQDACNLFGCHAVYANYGGIVFGGDEGDRIAAALGAHNKAAVLMNHGLLTVGRTVDEAAYLLELLDRSCAIQLSVEAAAAGNGGLVRNIISDEEAAYNCSMASESHALYREWQGEFDFECQRVGGEHILVQGLEEVEIWVDQLAAMES